MVELSENILDLDPDHGKIFRNYSTLVTPNFVQTAFGPNNWDRRLKFCLQSLVFVIYIDHEEHSRSEVIILTSINSENTGKYHFFTLIQL